MKFSERLALLMAENHETKYRISKIVGVHQSTVNYWLTGKSVPQLEHAKKLAEHYDCSIEELLSNK